MWMKTAFSTFSNIVQTIIWCKYKETGTEMKKIKIRTYVGAIILKGSYECPDSPVSSVLPVGSIPTRDSGL